MAAAWYADPLGRFEGRFFDGENWTERVSDDGVLSTDPDWPPSDQLAAGDQSEAEQGTVDTAGEREPEAEPVTEQAPVDAADGPEPGEAADESTNATFEDDRSQPAVEAAGVVNHATADLENESPTRAVAVVDDPADGESGKANGSNSSRWMYALGTAALLAGILLLFLPSLFDDDDDEGSSSTGPEDVTEQVEEEVAEIEAGVAPETTDDAAAEPPLDPDNLRVGGLVIVNATSELAALADWHRSHAADRDIELGGDAACWYATIDGATVHNAYCGPVDGTDTADFVYDLVPVEFTDVGPDRIEVAPQTTETLDDSRLPSGLELIGPAPAVEAPIRTDVGSRGSRETDE